ncbi:MAG: hypothetical protein K2X11_16020 [Acetobacteraceae bacterium]|nr:hypothetical protein [Acetobacteraceae bacterium]
MALGWIVPPDEGKTTMRDVVVPLMEQIERWQGVAPPNAAARHGLKDLVALIRQLEALRGTLVFEEEPATFEAALLAEKGE